MTITVFLTIWVSIIIAIVSYQQYKVAHVKLKLDLYEKRFAVFQGVREFLSIVLAKANFDMSEFYMFRAKTAEVDFLFGTDVVNFIKQVDKDALDFHVKKASLEGVAVGNERSRLVEAEIKALEKLTNKITEIKVVFRDYLELSKLK